MILGIIIGSVVGVVTAITGIYIYIVRLFNKEWHG